MLSLEGCQETVLYSMLLATSFLHLVRTGEVATLRIPEGIFDYPKTIAEIPLTSPNTTTCSVNDVITLPSNRSLISSRPIYFGVEFDSTSITTEPSQLTTTIRSVESAATPTFGDTTTVTTLTRSTFRIETSSIELAKATTDHRSLNTSTTTSAAAIVGTGVHHSTMASETTTTKPRKLLLPRSLRGAPHRADLVQLYDLDREKTDSYLITVRCFDHLNEKSEMDQQFHVEVTDINDNTPVFIKSTLTANISSNFSTFDMVMQINATDADIGKNAQLEFGIISGTVRGWFANGSRDNSVTMYSVFVLPDGSVYLSDKAKPGIRLTFRVSVKDRGSSRGGNRMMATATINVMGGEPCIGESTASPEGKTSRGLQWWKIFVPTVVVVAVLAVLVIIGVKIKRRRSAPRAALVIDDEFLLADDTGLGS